MPARPRVVIVGAGLGGLAAAHGLARAPVGVTVVDTHNYTAFPPLLFQASVGVISPEDVVRPVRSLLGGRGSPVGFRMGTVVGIDWNRRVVGLAGGDELPFDQLVLAPGVVAASAGVEGATRHAVPLKSVTDAARLRNSVLRSFEGAAADPAHARPGATGVAVIGGGASGVEVAGYLADILFRSFVRDFPSLARDRMRLTIVEVGDRLLPAFHPRLGRYAERMLRRRGVDVRLRSTVTRVDGDGVVLDSGERIEAATVVWGGGVQAAPWLAASGVELDHGRVVVDEDLRVRGHPEAFAIGDVAAVRAPQARLYPQVAQVAIQGGRHVAREIATGRREPFRYWDKGSMAVIGCNAAVVESGRIRLTGRLAWVAWGLLHLVYLKGMPNRLSIAQKWRWWHVTHEASTRVLIEDDRD